MLLKSKISTNELKVPIWVCIKNDINNVEILINRIVIFLFLSKCLLLISRYVEAIVIASTLYTAAARTLHARLTPIGADLATAATTVTYLVQFLHLGTTPDQ